MIFDRFRPSQHSRACYGTGVVSQSGPILTHHTWRWKDEVSACCSVGRLCLNGICFFVPSMLCTVNEALPGASIREFTSFVFGFHEFTKDGGMAGFTISRAKKKFNPHLRERHLGASVLWIFPGRANKESRIRI